MVYKKARSGDPDYDDKVPMRTHMAEVKEAPDGVEYLDTPDRGPVTLDGEHFNLAEHDPDNHSQDNRPAPGEVATEDSAVQQYSDVVVEAAAETSKPATKRTTK